jgi:hypothetical protein
MNVFKSSLYPLPQEVKLKLNTFRMFRNPVPLAPP